MTRSIDMNPSSSCPSIPADTWEPKEPLPATFPVSDIGELVEAGRPRLAAILVERGLIEG